MNLQNVYVDHLMDIFRHGLNLQSFYIVLKSSQLYTSPILNFNLLLFLSRMLLSQVTKRTLLAGLLIMFPNGRSRGRVKHRVYNASIG